uniref:Uncharacterized protein n=1 Tax=Leersia perrieri TaxID=77586 RepID=A0A0D9VS27_9ORYZ
MGREGEELVQKQQQLPLELKLKERLIDWQHCYPHRVLHVILTQPEMSGRDGPAWQRFSFLDAYLGGEKLGSAGFLPITPRDVPWWNATCQRFVGWDWPHLCLQLEAHRTDAYMACDGAAAGKVVVFRGDEPHTSRHSAVIGTAQVRLLDALVHGDGDDDGERGGGQCYFGREEYEERMLKGTRVFDKVVELQWWQPPAPGEAGGQPANVVRGTVRVAMCLTVH